MKILLVIATMILLSACVTSEKRLPSDRRNVLDQKLGR